MHSTHRFAETSSARVSSSSPLRAAETGLGRSLGLGAVALVALATACSKPATSEAQAPVQSSPPPAAPTSTATGAPGDAEAPQATDASTASEGKPTMTNAALETALAADAQAANTFTLNAYAKAQKGSPGNLLLSGTSLRHAMGVAYLGARGETAHELSSVLGFSADPVAAAEIAQGENAAWQTAKGKAGEGAALVVADRLWADKTFHVAPTFEKLAASIGSEVGSVDFLHAAEEARTTINGWVSDKTAKKIPELIAKGLIDARTRVVVTNAIYFKGAWALPFSKGATEDGTFTQAGGKKVKTPLMHATETFRMVEAGNVKVLDMGYQGTHLAMTVVLPKDPAGLGKVEASLTAATLDGWMKDGPRTRVAVTLPKFTFGWGGTVTRTLKDLGIKTAFSDKADFSGLASPEGKEHLEISEVVHKTWIAVDEAGTEAAAATGVMMRTTGMPMGPVAEFKADHPFLFFIRDTKTGRILFVGRVTEPKAS